MQGLAVHPDTGALWATEHGPQGGDELNLIEAGKNYGWPVITFGREYSGEVISTQPAKEGLEQPFMFWAPSPGLSGMVIYSGDKFAGWKGQFFLGALAGTGVWRVGMNDNGLGRTRADAQLAATAHPRRPARARRVPVSRRRRQSRRDSAHRARNDARRLGPVAVAGQVGV